MISAGGLNVINIFSYCEIQIMAWVQMTHVE